MEFSGQRPCCVLKLGVDLFTSVLHGRHFLPLAYHLFLSVLLLHFLNVFVLVPPADCSEVTFFENGFQDKRRSKRVESWARARFDAWRALHKRPTAEAIEDLCDHDRKELEELVELFLTQVCKQNGKEYPHQTIGSLLRALGRVTRAHQEARIAETQVPEAPLNIMSDVRFKKAGQAVSDNVASAGRLGLGKRRKCISILTLLDEAAMLALSTYKCTSAKGCSMRFAYFCTQKFFIRGTAELHELTDMDFTLGKDQHGDYEKRLKSWSSDCPLSHPEKFSLPMTCYIEDVSTHKIMIQHKPKWAEYEPPPRPIILTDVKNPTSRAVMSWRFHVSVLFIRFCVKNIRCTVNKKTKERRVHLERRLHSKEFEGAGDPDRPPPPYSDIVLETSDGWKAYKHEAVVASQSEDFKAMFSMPMVEEYPLHMETSHTALDTIIFFFYRATVNQGVLRNHLVELLQAADKYGVESLNSICEQ
uniref:BTB domain-containing protein n=1 Tax=Physcomitrium patens TaxID=3218 RepID=A0A2K1JG63_PHYPA|nr:hypothetical protein PHYPA_017900 [Physcomitrium patens]